MKRIGIISDTHGTFDDTLREFLKDVDEIWHAGDIGSLELADTIASFKPGAAGEYGFHKVRTAVRLVIDGADMRDMEVGEWPRK